VRPSVFLTGATGFLGMEVLARLLEAGDRDVVALVRAEDTAAAERRLDGVLETLWRDPAPYRDRVRAVAGDLTEPGLGLDPVERHALAEDTEAVLHCAASISFDLPLEEARRINVEGTREVIGFAREAKSLGRLDRFLHVSTAYVAGAYPGTFRERQLVAGQQFRNTYERTKWEAEQVIAAAGDLSPAVVRPSIVMGESDSGWTPAFNVLYWPLRAFSRGLFDTVPALAEGRVDVVPVDYVADGIVHLLDRGEAGVFNLVAGRDAPTVAELIGLGCERFGRPAPELVPPGNPTALADGEVYLPYFDMKVVFDDTRARAVLGPAGISAPRLESYFGTLIDYAEAAKWGKRPVTREEARERVAAVAAA
jgi:long-chain acyl-CoA synthetase